MIALFVVGLAAGWVLGMASAWAIGTRYTAKQKARRQAALRAAEIATGEVFDSELLEALERELARSKRAVARAQPAEPDHA